MKQFFIITAVIAAILSSCSNESRLVILAAEETEYNKCREIFPEIECIRTGVGAGNVIKTCCNLASYNGSLSLDRSKSFLSQLFV